MKNILRLIKYARKYWNLLIISGISMIAITLLNLVSPWMITKLMDILTGEFTEASMKAIGNIAVIIGATLILKIVFRFLNNYMGHKAAWNLVADMRVLVYDHMQKLSLRYYQDKQTGQLYQC